jgi:hypothetical protein
MRYRIGRSRKKAGAMLVLSAVVGAILAAPAQADPVYWTLRNERSGWCLTGGEAGSGDTSARAWITRCTGGRHQQWDWVGADNDRLQNRATGMCLMTDDKSNRNSVWTSLCSTAQGQKWRYRSQLDVDTLVSQLSSKELCILLEDGVYTEEISSTSRNYSYFQWDRLT